MDVWLIEVKWLGIIGVPNLLKGRPQIHLHST